MKFKNYLTSIEGISVFPMIGLFLFLIFFVGLLFYVYKMDKKVIEETENLPIN